MIATRQSIQAAVLLVAVLASASAFSTLSGTPSTAATRLQQQHPLHLLHPKSASNILQSPRQLAHRSPLFSQSATPASTSSSDDNTTNNNNPLQRVKSLIRVFQLHAWRAAFVKAQVQLRRAVVVLAASAMIWMGTSAVSAPPAQASTSVLQRVMPSNDADKIIDRYVRSHMFDDDDSSATDPLESAYREAFEDYNTKGTYPKAIQAITADVLGSSNAAKSSRMNEGEASGGFITALMATLGFMQRRTGMSERTAMLVIATTATVSAPLGMGVVGMIVGGISKRNMNKLMKSRYGETYSVDATIKTEPDVDAPDDEDDDDDDDDDNDDDDDSDDDDE